MCLHQHASDDIEEIQREDIQRETLVHFHACLPLKMDTPKQINSCLKTCQRSGLPACVCYFSAFSSAAIPRAGTVG